MRISVSLCSGEFRRLAVDKSLKWGVSTSAVEIMEKNYSIGIFNVD